MATKRTNNPKGRTPKDPAKPVRARVALTPTQAKKMTDKLQRCVDKGLDFAYGVLANKEQIVVEKFTRHGETVRFKSDKYTPELKLRILEILIGKVFAEKKDIGIDPMDEGQVNVVGFNFVPVKKKEDEQ